MPVQEKIFDLHLHSRFSRACSFDLTLENIGKICQKKGVDVVSTADFTHPTWFESIKTGLKERTAGIYELKSGDCSTGFVLGTEISFIKKHKEKTRRVHLCVLAPEISAVEKIINFFKKREINLSSDGRPIIGMTVKDALSALLEIDERITVIPAHAWTPWFGIFGSMSGYDSLEEAFEELAPRIRAIETGLSSDPPMNHQWSALDKISLVSNSDAHSLGKIGREANVLAFEDGEDITYDKMLNAIFSVDRKKFLYTIEFYPEEGKYHFDGHRSCDFSCGPEETKKRKGLCPKCGGEMVLGVLNRVSALTDRTLEEASKMNFIPHKSMVPLEEIIAEAIGVGVKTKKTTRIYDALIESFDNEFNVLLRTEIKDVGSIAGDLVALALDKVRKGDIYIKPGYDGEFGVVKVFSPEERKKIGQTSLF